MGGGAVGYGTGGVILSLRKGLRVCAAQPFYDGVAVAQVDRFVRMDGWFSCWRFGCGRGGGKGLSVGGCGVGGGVVWVCVQDVYIVSVCTPQSPLNPSALYSCGRV